MSFTNTGRRSRDFPPIPSTNLNSRPQCPVPLGWVYLTPLISPGAEFGLVLPLPLGLSQICGVLAFMGGLLGVSATALRPPALQWDSRPRASVIQSHVSL